MCTIIFNSFTNKINEEVKCVITIVSMTTDHNFIRALKYSNYWFSREQTGIFTNMSGGCA